MDRAGDGTAAAQCTVPDPGRGIRAAVPACAGRVPVALLSRGPAPTTIVTMAAILSSSSASTPPTARHRVPVVVHLLLFAANRVLLLRRAGTGRADGYWAPPGGHLEAGELPSRAAVRECAEEVGLRIDPALLQPVAALFYEDPAGTDDAVGLNMLFAARVPAPLHGSDALHLGDEADACEWWPVDALPEPRLRWLDDALRRANDSTDRVADGSDDGSADGVAGEEPGRAPDARGVGGCLWYGEALPGAGDSGRD